MLALHGFTGTGQDFEALAPHLDVGLMAPDLPGHGRTPPTAMATAVSMLRPLAEGRVVLGYSMGGRTALQVAASGCEVRALVLVGATPGIADPVARKKRQKADEALADRIEQIGVEAFLAEWSHKPIIASQERIAADWRVRMATRRRQHRADGLAGSLRGMGTGSMVPVWDALPDIPTLLVVGEEDAKFTMIAENMAVCMREAEVVVIPGVGHCAHLESPEAVADAIHGFLRRID